MLLCQDVRLYRWSPDAVDQKQLEMKLNDDVEMMLLLLTVLAAASVDCAETSASNDTVRRMHDDNVELSNKCGLPGIEQKQINP